MDIKWKTRKFINSRDCHTCRNCGHQGLSNIIHHVNKNRKDNSTINLITLCPSCHVRLHYKNRVRGVSLPAFCELNNYSPKKFIEKEHCYIIKDFKEDDILNKILSSCIKLTPLEWNTNKRELIKKYL